MIMASSDIRFLLIVFRIPLAAAGVWHDGWGRFSFSLIVLRLQRIDIADPCRPNACFAKSKAIGRPDRISGTDQREELCGMRKH